MGTKINKINNIIFFIASVLLLFFSAATYINAKNVEENIEEVTDIKPIDRKGEIKIPTVLDVKRSIAEMEKDGVTIFTRVFNIDRSAGIQELFQKCRDTDKAVKDAGTNPTTKKLMESYATRKYKKAHRKLQKIQGKYFEVIGPERIKRLEKGRFIKKSFLPEMKQILRAADAAFEKTVGNLRMSLFIDWSKVPGRIYVIVEPENWLLVGGLNARSDAVQTVIAKPETREFYLFAGDKIYDYADQAIKYSVAKVIYQEYAKIISGKPDARLPFYFLEGAAAEAGGTEAIITAAGPKQVQVVRIFGKTIKVKRPKKGIMLPLRKKNLYSLDELIKFTRDPSQGEAKYYFLRQTKQLIQTLRDKAPLSYICFVRALSSGKEFKKEIGLSYMEMQRDVEGREVKIPAKKKKKKKQPDWYSRTKQGEEKVDPKYKDYARFSKYMNAIFNKLTEEYMAEQWKKQKAEKAKKAKEAKKAEIETKGKVSKESKKPGNNLKKTETSK